MRVVICGGPRAGKTTLAGKMGEPETRCTDELIGKVEWSAASQLVADEWFTADGPWIVEGVATARALRKALIAQPDVKPCDRAIWVAGSRELLTKRQRSMAAGVEKVWREVRPQLVALGVEIGEGNR